MGNEIGLISGESDIFARVWKKYIKEVTQVKDT
jgi:hypothetical protein